MTIGSGWRLLRPRVALKFWVDEAREEHLPHLLLPVSRRVRVASRTNRVRIPDQVVPSMDHDLTATGVADDLPCTGDRFGLGIRVGAVPATTRSDDCPPPFGTTCRSLRAISR